MRHSKKHLKLPFLALTSALCLTFTANISSANDKELEPFFSETGIYRVKTLKDPEVERSEFRTEIDTTISAETMKAVMDQRPFRNNVQTFIIQLQQTIGEGLSIEERNHLIDKALNEYQAHYEKNGAEIITREKKYFEKLPGGELYLTYNDPESGLQAMRIRVLFSDVSKIQQIYTGGDESAFIMRTQEFFNSLGVNIGKTKSEGNIIDDWKEYTSPLRIYSALLPEKVVPYVKEDPVVKHGETNDLIGVVLHDPVREADMTYSITGYKSNAPLDYTSAQYLVTSKHLTRHMRTPKGISFQKLKNSSDQFILESAFSLGSADIPEAVKTIKIRATFQGRYLMVQELVTSKALINSTIAANLMGHTLFHPDEAEKFALGGGVAEQENSTKPDQPVPASEPEDAPKATPPGE